MNDITCYCPLHNNDIPQGLCFDINLQRLGYFKHDALAEVQSLTGKLIAEINQTCDICSNQPLQNKN